MRKIVLFTFCFFFLYLSAGKLSGQDRGYGLGIILGEPTGFSAKYWVNENNAFDLAIAYSFTESENSFALHADYLYHLFNVIESEHEFPVYYGFGGRFRANSFDTGLGVRGVVGVSYFSNEFPFDVFFEIAPVFELIPSTELDIDVGLGARYFFN